MAVIINVRGTSGSGKSTAVRYVMKKLGIKHSIVSTVAKYDGVKSAYRLSSNGTRVVGYRLANDVIVLGRYETDCGGCDSIKTQDEIVNRIIKLAPKTKVLIFEGLIIGTVYTRYHELSMRLKHDGHKFIFAFLDTSLKTCISRIESRRLKAGNNKPLNPIHTANKHRSIKSVKRHAIADCEKVVMLDGDCAGRQLLSLVKSLI